MRRRIAVAAALTLGLMASTGGIAGAGQPGVDCADFAQRPGNAISASGSAFNPDGHSGTVYAGEQPQNSNNVKSVSQYDVACAKVSAGHGP